MPLPGNAAAAGTPAGTAGPAGKMTAGVGGVIVKFVVPVAGFFGGFSMSGPVVKPLADFIIDFVPFVRRIDKSVRERSGSTWIAIEIAALIIIGVSMTIAYFVRSFMGGGFWGNMIAVGIASFGIGIGVKGIIDGFGPAKAAVEAIK